MNKQNDVGGVDALLRLIEEYGDAKFSAGTYVYERGSEKKYLESWLDATSIHEQIHALLASPAAVGGGYIEPDMCWNADNPEDSNGDPEQIADYEVDGIGLTSNDDPVYIDVLCAKSLPSRQMKLWVEKMPDGEEYTMWEFMPIPASPAATKEG